MHRRDFIRGAAAAPFCFGPDAWAAVSDEGPRRLVVILLRGALDGLNVVIPYADATYYQERQSIAIAPPGKPDGALALDGHFGLHPALASLMTQIAPRRNRTRPLIGPMMRSSTGQSDRAQKRFIAWPRSWVRQWQR